MWAGFWYGFCTGAIVILLCWIKSLSPRGFRAALRLGLEDTVFVAGGGVVMLLPEGPSPAEWRCGS